MRPSWVKIWTKILDNEAVQDLGAPALAVLVWLVVKAAEAQPAGAPVRISAGALGEALHLSRFAVREVLERLEADKVIEVARSGKGRGHMAEVKLLKYERYQSRPKSAEAGPPANPAYACARASHFTRHFSAVDNSRNANDLRSAENETAPFSPPFSEGARARTEEIQNLKEFPFPFPRARTRTRGTPEEEEREREREFLKRRRYPEDPAEVVTEARTRGYEITTAEAESFIEMNAARGWMFDGTPVKMWPRLLVSFLRSLGRRTQREADEEKRKEREKRQEEQRRRKAAEAERLKGETLVDTKTAAEILKQWDKK